MINVFIPHRWNNNDYSEISALLDRTKFNVRDYSVPSSSPFDKIDRRYNVDPQIQKRVLFRSVSASSFITLPLLLSGSRWASCPGSS